MVVGLGKSQVVAEWIKPESPTRAHASNTGKECALETLAEHTVLYRRRKSLLYPKIIPLHFKMHSKIADEDSMKSGKREECGELRPGELRSDDRAVLTATYLTT